MIRCMILINLMKKKLPRDFCNRLNNEDISDESNEDAKKVWNIFICEKFKDYHEIYLKVDTLLLADVFENIRQTCHNTYKVDPSYYYYVFHGRVTLFFADNFNMIKYHVY